MPCCSGCHEDLGRKNFTVNQLRKKDARRCRVCEGGLPRQSCAVCPKAGTKECQKCKSVRYCSRDCQRKDWNAHKSSCRAQAGPQCAICLRASGAPRLAMPTACDHHAHARCRAEMARSCPEEGTLGACAACVLSRELSEAPTIGELKIRARYLRARVRLVCGIAEFGGVASRGREIAIPKGGSALYSELTRVLMQARQLDPRDVEIARHLAVTLQHRGHKTTLTKLLVPVARSN